MDWRFFVFYGANVIFCYVQEALYKQRKRENLNLTIPNIFNFFELYWRGKPDKSIFRVSLNTRNANCPKVVISWHFTGAKRYRVLAEVIYRIIRKVCIDRNPQSYHAAEIRSDNGRPLMAYGSSWTESGVQYGLNSYVWL